MWVEREFNLGGQGPGYKVLARAHFSVECHHLQVLPVVPRRAAESDLAWQQPHSFPPVTAGPMEFLEPVWTRQEGLAFPRPTAKFQQWPSPLLPPAHFCLICLSLIGASENHQLKITSKNENSTNIERIYCVLRDHYVLNLCSQAPLEDCIVLCMFSFPGA